MFIYHRRQHNWHCISAMFALVREIVTWMKNDGIQDEYYYWSIAECVRHVLSTHEQLMIEQYITWVRYLFICTSAVQLHENVI